MSRVRRPLIAIIALVAALAACSSAEASTITLGSPLTGTFTPNKCTLTPCTLAQGKLPGATLTSPVNGVVIRWRMIDGSSTFHYKLRVLDHMSGLSFTGSGTSAAATPTGTGVETFSTALPIQAGEEIGIDLEAQAPLGESPVAGASYLFWSPPIADGTTTPAEEELTPIALGFNADVLPAPTVSSISQASGSIAGGASVVISGGNFAELKGVSFGSTPASSYVVNSESQITAIAPASATLAKVPITVTTIAGTATSPNTFAYEGCVVPKLAGKKLKASKKKTKAADCKIGKVTKKEGATAKTGKVKKQSPKAGKILAPGSKVNVTLKP